MAKGKKPLSKQIEEAAQSPPQEYVWEPPVDWGKPTLSTGSTLLNLAISGGKTRYGGLPGGKFVEIFGMTGLGKTTIAGEIAGAGQRAGGEVIFDDAEHRLDPTYCKEMGIKYDPTKFHYPETVTDLEEAILGPIVVSGTGKFKKEQRDFSKGWAPDHTNINVRCVDSLAAFCSRMERDQGDKMGMKRAKDFHQMFRLIKGHILRHNILLVATNQVTQSGTTGGNAIIFYASVRIQLSYKDVIKSTGGIVIGKRVEAFVLKSSVDIEWRTAPIFLVHGYGIDDIRGNLVFLKETGAMEEHPTDPKKQAGYVVGNKNFVGVDKAIAYVEENDLEENLREMVVDHWNELELKARPPRKEKVR